ncbi:MAG: hypothetical protein RL754_48 [Bacteroidota bacterium]|jgi:hypothetical protein
MTSYRIRALKPVLGGFFLFYLSGVKQRRNILSGLLLVFLLSSCSNQTDDVEQATTMPKRYPLNEQYGAKITYSDSARSMLEIEAGVVKDFGNMDPPYIYFGGGLKVYFFNGGERASTVLLADTARQLEKEELWAIGGNVVVTNGKGERMTTELLYWNQKEERLYSESLVQIRSEGQLITGKGFEADQEFNTYRIFNVQGEITIDENE